MILTVSNIFSKSKCHLSGACFSPYSALLAFMILDPNRSTRMLGGSTYTTFAGGARTVVVKDCYNEVCRVQCRALWYLNTFQILYALIVVFNWRLFMYKSFVMFY
jgi:hypothetical protein